VAGSRPSDRRPQCGVRRAGPVRCGGTPADHDSRRRRLNATALVAAVGDASAFRRGRDLSAWLGLVPKQQTTGGKPKLLGISKRGNKYLRMLFIHGARAAMPTLAKSVTPIGAWLRGLLARTHRNIAIVALANKLARIAWAMLKRDRDFALNHGAVAG
jgi:transposase